MRDTTIRTYRAKRDFVQTPEPQPGPGRAGETLRFVVQKHAARRLHWDFRLEHGGVLWSWAVPKAPSLDPADKRLAVRVEDHPLDYAQFHGTIPQGNYGAGTVEIWDEGTWEPLGDAEAGLDRGELKFRLAGQRLRGGFVLVRMRPRGRERAENWLLIKERDAEAQRTGAVKLTHADRALWPGISKQDLARYWEAVADHALPGIAQRPLALLRCPEGIDGPRFFQKHASKGMPPQIRAAEAPEGPFLAIDDTAGLLACAQIAAIELHAWSARESDPAHPDRVVFDLDPGEGVKFTEIVRAAKEIRGRLDALKLASFCRTTGGKGLHVVVPLRPEAGWDAVGAFAHRLAQAMERDAPDRFVSTVPKAKRRGRILVDWLRNTPGASAVASFSPRARPGAAVAIPIAWREVTARLDPLAFTIATVPGRLRRLRTDPWSGFNTVDQTLPEEMP